MSTTTFTQTGQQPLGSAVPPFTAHAISVSLPTWRDNVGYEEGEKRVVDAMVSGYPRFFIHLSIQKVCVLCLIYQLAVSAMKYCLLPLHSVSSFVDRPVGSVAVSDEHEQSSVTTNQVVFVFIPVRRSPISESFMEPPSLKPLRTMLSASHKSVLCGRQSMAALVR